MESQHDTSRAAYASEGAQPNADGVGATSVSKSEDRSTVGPRGKRRIKSDREGYTICRICTVEKPDAEYYKNYGTCKTCCYKRNRKSIQGRESENAEYMKKYAEANREKVRAIKTRWRKENPEKARASVKASTSKNREQRKAAQSARWRKNLDENRRKAREKQAAYMALNRKEVNAQLRARSTTPEYRERQRLKRKTNIVYRLRCVLRRRVSGVASRRRAGSAVRDAGCTVAQLKTYLESKFLPGMTWENHSPTGWHIDHIRPLASFDLTDREQFLQAAHYTNLQPLWATENLRKSDKILE